MSRSKPMERAFMPLYVGRYLRKTRRLGVAEHGAYMLILMTLWEEGGTIPDDETELRRICNSPRNWSKIWAAIKPYFTIEGGCISQSTLSEYLAEFERLRASKVRGGKRAGQIHAKKQQKIKGRSRAQPEDSSSSKAKGFASPSIEGERQSLDAESEDLFYRVTGVVLSRGFCTDPQSVAQVRAALVSFDGTAFEVSEACVSARDWNTLKTHVAGQGYELRLAAQRSFDLKLIEGGRC